MSAVCARAQMRIFSSENKIRYIHAAQRPYDYIVRVIYCCQSFFPDARAPYYLRRNTEALPARGINYHCYYFLRRAESVMLVVVLLAEFQLSRARAIIKISRDFYF